MPLRGNVRKYEAAVDRPVAARAVPPIVGFGPPSSMEKTYRDEGWEAYVDRILRQHHSNGNAIIEDGDASGGYQPLSLGVGDVLLLNEVLASLGGSPVHPASRMAPAVVTHERSSALTSRSPASPQSQQQEDGPRVCNVGEGAEAAGQWVVMQATPMSSPSHTPQHTHTQTQASPVLAPSTASGRCGGASGGGAAQSSPLSSTPIGTSSSHTPPTVQWYGGSVGSAGSVLMSVCSGEASASPCSLDLLASPSASQLAEARRLTTLPQDSLRAHHMAAQSPHAMDVASASPGTPVYESSPRRRLLWSPTQAPLTPSLDLDSPSPGLQHSLPTESVEGTSVDVGALAEQLADAHLQPHDSPALESPPESPPKAPQWTARPGTLQLEVKGRVGCAVEDVGLSLPLQVKKALTWVSQHSPPPVRRPLQPRSTNTQHTHHNNTHSPHKASSSEANTREEGGILVQWGEGQGSVGLREALVAQWATQDNTQAHTPLHSTQEACGSWGGHHAGTLVVVSGVSKLRQWEAALRALPLCVCPSFVLLPQPPLAHSLVSLSKAALVITTTQVPLDRDPLVPTWLGKRGRPVSSCPLGSRLMLLRWRRLLVDDAHKLLTPAQAPAAHALRRLWADRGRWLLVDGKAVSKSCLWGPKEHDKIKGLAPLLENDYGSLSPLLQQYPSSGTAHAPPRPSTYTPSASGPGTDLAAFSRRVHVMAS